MSKATTDIQPLATDFIALVQQHYQTTDFIPLHAPCIGQPEKLKLNACIDSTFVSSVGQFVTDFEQQFIDYTQARHAVAVVNGTMGLFLALKTVGVESNDLVITQSLTFVATPNAIKMLNADPLFLDVDKSSYGLSADCLQTFLNERTHQQNGQCVHTETGRRVSACVPMHTLGFSVEIERIVKLCKQHNLKLVEDAAESLGSFYQGKHTGTFGDIGVFSFNGNKIITTGGGGMLVTNNTEYAERAKHLSTTAKVPHAWLFEHDEIAYNLRMPNLNAALGVAQFEQLEVFLTEKKALATCYTQFVEHNQNAKSAGLLILQNVHHGDANFWLNGFIFDHQTQRDAFLAQTNQAGIQTRPLWTPMHQLAIYQDAIRTELPHTEWLAERIVNIPSGVKCH
ncbi:MAG: LegC family aminotransferase [Thiotrichales bacterium]|nr:LegC family aminotransferase [Thiotrichales bacterium]